MVQFGKIIIDLLKDLTITIISGIVISYLFGQEVFQLLNIDQASSLRIVVFIIIALFIYSSYKFIRSIRFHRGVERKLRKVYDFLHNWDEMKDAFNKYLESDKPRERDRFESIRSQLLIDYMQISSMVTRYETLDPLTGIHIKNYDAVGNTISVSPLTGIDRFQYSFMAREFDRNYDMGRTSLLGIIGVLSPIRDSIYHHLLILIKVCPDLFLEKKEGSV